MNKYDFGYELNRQVDPVGQWAFEQIRSGARVLEVGSSNGRLSKHLKEDLGCHVDIVEINAEAGEQAAQFAQNAWIGAAGDIESEDVYDQLKQQPAYDYIVFLDVLEHLREPEKVLERMGTLLAPGGKLVISVPNIAHNSVLIELWNNRFSYTPLGLLDDTHIHFFTPASFVEMAHRSGFFVCKISATQKYVGGNEIVNNYYDVPGSVAEYLRAREYADVYQILTVLSLESGEEPTLKLCSLPETLCHIRAKVYYGDSEAQSVPFYWGLHHAEIMLDAELLTSSDQVRLDPMEQAGFVRLISAQGIFDDRQEKLELLWHNGMVLREGEYLFDTGDPQLMFKKPDGVKQIRFIFDGNIFPVDCVEHISGIMEVCRQTQDRLSQRESSLTQSRAELAEQQERLRQSEETLGETRGELEWTSRALGETREELNKTAQSLGETRGELEWTNRALGETREELNKTAHSLGETRGELEWTNRALGETREELNKTAQSLGETRGELEWTNRALGETRGELEWTRRALGETREELNKTTQSLEETRGALDERSKTLEEVQNQLQQAQNELQRIYTSRSWRFMSFFWRIKAFLKRLLRKA